MKKTCMTFVFLINSIFANPVNASDDLPTLLDDVIACLTIR